MFEVQNALLEDILKRDLSFFAVAQIRFFAFGNVVRAEYSEVVGKVAEDDTDCGVAAALLVVNCEAMVLPLSQRVIGSSKEILWPKLLGIFNMMS